VQRLYSTFATGTPGAGLLIMRLVAGTVLLSRGIEGLRGELSFGPPSVHIIRIVLGLLAIAGLWTPVMGVLTAILEVALFFVGAGDVWIHVLLTTLGICLSLLGPGAWSVDARLFGWRRIDIHDPRSPR
jgi:putative oxidoreductase